MGGARTAERRVDVSTWASVSTWVGDGMRREVLFFPSGGLDLYASIYAADPLRTPLGVVICNSWGYEANLAGNAVHSLAIAAARAGGVALSFHYPGFGDSEGGDTAANIDAMAGAARDAVGEAARRYPQARWTLAGLMLGASVAALAADRGAPAGRLLLIQPALRPGRYFARLERASKRSLGGPAPEPAPGFAYGYPLTPALLASAPTTDGKVEAALAGFAGPGAVVRHERPEIIDGAPERFEQVLAPGAWRFGLRDLSRLTAAAAAWLSERFGEEA